MRASGLLSCALLVACGAAPAAEPKDAGARDSAATAQDASATEEPTPECVVSGVVADPSGQPWLGATVQVCSESLCTLGKAPSGSFAVDVPCGAFYHVIAREDPGDTRPASAGVSVIADEVTSDVSLAAPVTIPVTPAPAALASGTQSIDLTTELTLTLDPADLVFYGNAAVAAVRVDPGQWPAFVIQGKTVLAMWALAPWGTRARAGKTIGVTVKNVFGLSAGDGVSFFAVSETTASLLVPTQGTVTSDGALVAGATIDRVTWIVVAR